MFALVFAFLAAALAYRAFHYYRITHVGQAVLNSEVTEFFKCIDSFSTNSTYALVGDVSFAANAQSDGEHDQEHDGHDGDSESGDGERDRDRDTERRESKSDELEMATLPVVPAVSSSVSSVSSVSSATVTATATAESKRDTGSDAGAGSLDKTDKTAADKPRFTFIPTPLPKSKLTTSTTSTSTPSTASKDSKESKESKQTRGRGHTRSGSFGSSSSPQSHGKQTEIATTASLSSLHFEADG